MDAFTRVEKKVRLTASGVQASKVGMVSGGGTGGRGAALKMGGNA